MERYPGYTRATLLVGIVNLLDTGALLLAAVFGFIGFLKLGKSPFWGLILMVFAAVVLFKQIRTRMNFLLKSRALRYHQGRLEVRYPESGEWLPADRIESFRKETFLYSDPWRPFTEGFPGIEIKLKGVGQTVEDCFAYGQFEIRDLVFERLQKLYPERVIISTPENENDPEGRKL